VPAPESKERAEKEQRKSLEKRPRSDANSDT